MILILLKIGPFLAIFSPFFCIVNYKQNVRNNLCQPQIRMAQIEMENKSTKAARGRGWQNSPKTSAKEKGNDWSNSSIRTGKLDLTQLAR